MLDSTLDCLRLITASTGGKSAKVISCLKDAFGAIRRQTSLTCDSLERCKRLISDTGFMNEHALKPMLQRPSRGLDDVEETTVSPTKQIQKADDYALSTSALKVRKIPNKILRAF